jgi:hypothetical protein
MSKESRYPFPVYCATFADGRVGRLSFWSPQGKPFDFARGRKASAVIYGRPDNETAMKVYPLADVTAGHVEWNGERTADPFFADGTKPVTTAAKVSWKALAAAARALLEAGDTVGALDMLKAA